MQIDIPIFWKTKKFVKFIILIQLLMLGTIGSDIIGLDIPVVRQIIGIIYLTFIPGILILRLFRLYDTDHIEFLLYSVGISISFLMFSGFTINTLYPLAGISDPLSDSNVILSISLFISMILVILDKFDAYNRDVQYTIKNIKIYIIYLLVLISILLVSILGTIYINVYGNNFILLILIILLMILLAILAFFDMSTNIYPITVFVIMLSVIYSISLISRYLAGYDIQMEYYFYRLVDNNSIWNSFIGNVGERSLNMNAMLSITILPVIYNRFLGMNGIEIFKVIYPFLFSFSFMGLYYIYSRYIGGKKAFFSVMLPISFIYYTSFETISLARQMVAQLFFVLLIILMLNKDIVGIKKQILFVIFASSLVVSHYGLSYIYMFILISVFFIRYVFDIRYISFFNKKMIIFYIIFIMSWYIYSSHSSTFNTIIKIEDRVLDAIATEFFSLDSRESNVLKAVGLQQTTTISFGRDIHRLIQIVTQLFIIIGAIMTLVKDKYNYSKDYILFVPMSLGIIFASIAFPLFSRETMNMTRLYQTTLLILSPFFIIGGEIFIGKILDTFRFIKDLRYTYDHLVLKIMVLFILIPYLGFNSGFIYEIIKDEPILNPIGIERIKTEGSNISKSSLYEAYITEQDIVGAIWLSDHRYTDRSVFAPRKGTTIFRSYTRSEKNVLTEKSLIDNKTVFREDDYLYLRYVNSQEGIFSYTTKMGRTEIIDNNYVIDNMSIQKNIIYDNGGSKTFILG